MLRFVQKLLAPKPKPIGVDFGRSALRLAQVATENGELILSAAATTAIPDVLQNEWTNAEARQELLRFFTQSAKDLLAQGNFEGREAVLSLPAAWVHARHVRVPKADAAQLQRAVADEVASQIPINVKEAELRHLLAGDVYQEQDPRHEVIVHAAAKADVRALLAAAEKAKLDVIGLNVQPSAVVDCFSHVYRRKADATSTVCFIDLGSSGTRAYVSQGSRLLFARAIDVAIPGTPTSATDISESALDEKHELLAQKLVDELSMCRRYHESTFPSQPIDRLIFIGAAANDKTLCQHIARALGLPAQLGDPLVRMSRTSKIGMEAGIDRRQPQPGWAVALGLTLGPAPVVVEKPVESLEEAA